MPSDGRTIRLHIYYIIGNNGILLEVWCGVVWCGVVFLFICLFGGGGDICCSRSCAFSRNVLGYKFIISETERSHFTIAHSENRIESNRIKLNRIKSKSNQIKSNRIKSDRIESNSIPMPTSPARPSNAVIGFYRITGVNHRGLRQEMKHPSFVVSKIGAPTNRSRNPPSRCECRMPSKRHFSTHASVVEWNGMELSWRYPRTTVAGRKRRSEKGPLFALESGRGKGWEWCRSFGWL